MFFTNTGRVYRLKAYEIPEAGRTARGTAIVNLLQLQPGEKITAIIPMREFNEDQYLFMATKEGMVKKTPMVEYGNTTKGIWKCPQKRTSGYCTERGRRTH